MKTPPRWERLVDHVATWYERPIEAADGEPPAAIEEVEDRLAVKLPTALGEFHRLIGRRLRSCGLHLHVPLARLGTEAVVEAWGLDEEAGLAFCGDHGGPSWIACLRPEDLEAGLADPAVALEGLEWSPPSLCEFLLGLVVTETLASVMAGHEDGPLGRLAADVDGGGVSDGAERVLADLKPLFGPWLLSEMFPEQVVVGPGMLVSVTTSTRDPRPRSFTWAAATREARARFERLQADPRRHEVIVRFRDLSPAEFDEVCSTRGSNLGLDPGTLLGMVSPGRDGRGVELHFVCEDIERDLPSLCRAVDPTRRFASRLEVGGRAMGRARYRPLWPAGLARFALPNRHGQIDLFA